jgi:glycosyltransferase involved in cell wall biosynthesis
VRTIAGVEISPSTRVVTYVSRGFESMRGFDMFMKSAKLIASQYADVAFIIVGTDKIAYGGDEQYIGNQKTFKQWVLEQDQYDLSKFHFVGRLSPPDLGRVLAAGDLHIYLTVPFVLSWSMMDAMSCGAVVLGSATSPVKEMIRDGENGLLADFFSPEEIASKAVRVLQNPSEFRPLGRAAEQMITERYSLEAVLPAMLQMYDEAAGSRPKHVAPPPIAQTSVQSFLPRISQDVISTSRPRQMKSSPFRG